MPYNFNVPDGANNISADLQAMKENFNKLGVLKVNQTGFPPADHGEIALVNKRLHVYDGNTGIWEGLNFFGFKNRIINGDFQIWQRGTSKTGITTYGYYTADRWKIWVNEGSYDEQKSTINNFNSKRVTVNTPSTSTNIDIIAPFWYIFEGQHFYDLAVQGKTVTLSFLFKSNVTGIFSVAMRNKTGNVVNESYVTEFNYTTANTPQKIIVQIPLNYYFTSLANDNNIGFELIIAGVGYSAVTSNLNTWLVGNHWISSNAVDWTKTAGNYVEIAQVQLEEGETATEFEYVPFEIQLLRCMRYYEKSYPYDIVPGTATWLGLHGIELPINGTGIFIPNSVIFRVHKRVTPSISTYSGQTGNSGVVVVDGTDRPATIQYISTVGFRATWSDTSTSKRWVYFQWVADAEL